MEDNLEDITHPKVKGSRIRHQLKTCLNSEYFTPKHLTQQSMDNQQINTLEDEQIQSIYNTATISDQSTPLNIEEALKVNEKEAWKKSAESEINNFVKRGSWEKVSREEAVFEGKKTIPHK